MRWAQTGWYASKATWHLTESPEGTEVARALCAPGIPISRARFLPEDRRPALARNNVCARCTKRYLRTRPDLQGYFDRLNDKKDV